MMGSILLTGFEPFDTWSTNPTAVAAEKLDGSVILNYKIIGRIIPLRFLQIQPSLDELVNEHQPRAIIMSGQSSSGEIRLEKIATNMAKSRIPYNCGTMTKGQKIEDKGPVEIQSNLPLQQYYA